MSWFRRKDPPAATPTCSFCGASQREVRKLVAAPRHHICDACVRLCVETLDAERPRLPEPASAADLPARLLARAPGQGEAARTLAALVTRHLAAGDAPAVLVVGPRGCGKTALLDALVDEAGVPGVRVDAGRLSAAGYVGDDLENFIGELAAKAPALAERGLLVVDGLERLAARERPARTATDVRGTRAQRHLVRLLDRGPVAVVTGKRHPSQPAPLVPTTGLMVVMAATLEAPPNDRQGLEAALEREGLEPELLRRLPLRLALPRRDADALTAVGRLIAAEVGVAPGEAALRALGARAAEHPDGGWLLRQVLSARAVRAAAGLPPEGPG